MKGKIRDLDKEWREEEIELDELGLMAEELAGVGRAKWPKPEKRKRG